MADEVRALKAAFDKACHSLSTAQDRLTELHTEETNLHKQLARVVKEREDLKVTIQRHQMDIESIMNQLPLTQLTPESASDRTGNGAYSDDQDDLSLAFLTQALQSSSPLDRSFNSDSSLLL